MNSIASTLTSILSTENAVISWENLSPTQQHNIQQGIDPKSQPSCVIYPHSQAELAAVITCQQSQMACSKLW